jgi:hypothetical protein
MKMRGAITKRSVEALAVGKTLYDDKIAGFLARRLPSGGISYGYRYRANGKQPLLALGVHGSITATDARRLAQRAAGRVAGGHDPQEEKAAHRAKVANSVNVVLDEFLARHVGAKGLRSARLIEASFRLHVRPAIGAVSIYDVTRARIIAVLDDVEDRSGPVAAHHAYKFTAQAFGWWALRDERFRSPIVKGMGRIKVKERERKRTLNNQEICDLWAALDIVKGVPPCLPKVRRLVGHSATALEDQGRGRPAHDGGIPRAARSRAGVGLRVHRVGNTLPAGCHEPPQEGARRGNCPDTRSCGSPGNAAMAVARSAADGADAAITCRGALRSRRAGPWPQDRWCSRCL